jgi:hypothetical protein
MRKSLSDLVLAATAAISLTATRLVTHGAKRALLASALLGALLFVPSPAKADMVTFDVNGIFADVPQGPISGNGTDTLSGTVVIDTSAGTVTAWDVKLALSSDFSEFFSGTPSLTLEFNSSPGTTTVGGPAVDISGLASGAFNYLELDLYVPVATLAGYPGGSLLDSSSPPLISAFGLAGSVGSEGSYAQLESGTGFLSPGVSPELSTPEPTSLTLLGTGFLAFAGFGICRRRRPATGSNSPVC